MKIRNALVVGTLSLAVAACGGGGGGGSGGASDSIAYSETKSGPGSTVANAETSVTQGAISYTNYQLWNTSIGDKAWAPPSYVGIVNFDAKSKAGSIKLTLPLGNEVISTADGYATVSWAGPFTTGAYRFNGNLLVGCNASAAIATEATQVFVSSSLERIKGVPVLDALNGLTFDVVDCTGNQGDTLKFNTDGSLTMSFTKSVASQNDKINMLNPESFGGALIDNKSYSGHLFRYGKDGSNKFAIVMQTTTGNINSRFRYFVAVQR